MGKIGAYEPEDKYTNYNLASSKPLKSHPVYEEKVWTLAEQIAKNLKKMGTLVENLYPKLTDDFAKNIKGMIDQHLGVLIEHLDHLERVLRKNPDSLSKAKLKKNKEQIAEMKQACDTLQTVRTYEGESKNLSKIKHTLHELEHLIEPAESAKPKKKIVVKKTKSARPSA